MLKLGIRGVTGVNSYLWHREEIVHGERQRNEDDPRWISPGSWTGSNQRFLETEAFDQDSTKLQPMKASRDQRAWVQ